MDPTDAERIFQLCQSSNGSTDPENALAKLILNANLSARKGSIALATLNILAAFLVFATIGYDCRRMARRDGVRRGIFHCWKSAISSANVVPLVLVLGALIQSLVFIGVQSTGLQNLCIPQCRAASQLVFPAIFIVPYLQVVLGIESALRGLRRQSFSPRGKYGIATCIAIVVVMLLLTWVPTYVRPQKGQCFAAVMGFVASRGASGATILVTMAATTGTCAFTILYRLYRIEHTDPRQRVDASSIAYYLVLGALSMTFIIPWFITLARKTPSVIAFAMATVVVSLNGILVALVYLSLRANKNRMTFPFKAVSILPQTKNDMEQHGINEMAFDQYLRSPVTTTVVTPRVMNHAKEARSSRSSERTLPSTPESENSSPANVEKCLSKSCPTRIHKKSPSYTIFPTTAKVPPPASNKSFAIPRKPLVSRARVRDTIISVFNSYATRNINKQTAGTVGLDHKFAADDLLEPPKPVFLGQHQRDHASFLSSATVMFGLRLSNAGDDLDVPSSPMASAPLHGSQPPEKRGHEESDHDKPSLATPTPQVEGQQHQHTSKLGPDESPVIPQELRDLLKELGANTIDTRMKSLPPIPHASTSSPNIPSHNDAGQITVYSQQPSPIQSLPTGGTATTTIPFPSSSATTSISSLPMSPTSKDIPIGIMRIGLPASPAPKAKAETLAPPRSKHHPVSLDEETAVKGSRNMAKRERGDGRRWI